MKMKIYGENNDINNNLNDNNNNYVIEDNDIIDKNGQNNFAKPFIVAEGSSKYSEIKN